MKIKVSKLRADRLGAGTPAAEPARSPRVTSRLALVLGTIIIGFAASGSAEAQSGIFGDLQAANDAPSKYRVQQFVDEGQSYPILDASQVTTAADLQDPIASISSEDNPLQQVAYQTGCQSCSNNDGGAAYGGGAYGGEAYGGEAYGGEAYGGEAYGGSCGGSCGGGCGGASGGRRSSFRGAFGPGYGAVCAECDPYCYASLDVLYIERLSDIRFSLSQNSRLGSFDYEGTITIGTVPDCVQGYEISVTTPFEWETGSFIVNEDGNLQSRLGVDPPLDDIINLSAFNNAIEHEQLWEAKYWSLEANSTSVGWEIAKVLCGARYIQYEERYQFRSLNAAGERGLIRSDVRNRLLGAQVGLDLLYPVCRNVYTDFRSRAGIFANVAESRAAAFNSGTTLAMISGDTAELAGIAEVKWGARYQLGELLSARFGLQYAYLGGIGAAPDQLRGNIDETYGGTTRLQENFFMFGFTFGAELHF